MTFVSPEERLRRSMSPAVHPWFPSGARSDGRAFPMPIPLPGSDGPELAEPEAVLRSLPGDPTALVITMAEPVLNTGNPRGDGGGGSARAE